jgi:hypothetical protein
MSVQGDQLQGRPAWLIVAARQDRGCVHDPEWLARVLCDLVTGSACSGSAADRESKQSTLLDRVTA